MNAPTPHHNHIPLLLFAAGVALRLTLLTYHGLEGDDAFSLAISHTPLTPLITGLMQLSLDVHPPLHFVILKGWVAWLGDSLPVLRALNLYADALTGALMVVLAGRGRARMFAAALWAFNPLLLFGGWLVRMYTLLGLLATAGAACVLRARGGVFWRWALGGALVGLVALYTHINGAIVVAGVGAGLLGVAWGRSWRAIAGVGGVFVLVGLLWLPFALPIMRLYTSGETLGAAVNPANTVNAGAVPAAVLSAAVAFQGDLPALPVALLVGGVLVVGLATKRTPTALTAAVYIIGIVALGAVGGLYKPRYVVPFVPLLLVGVAWGLARLPRLGGLLGLLGLLVLNGLGVRGTLARDWRDDWTAAAAFIETYTRPGDVIAVVPDWGQEAARYHYNGDAPVRGFFPQIAPTLNLDAAFSPYVANAPRVWLVRYQPTVSDPNNLARDWFTGRCPTVAQAFPAGADITLTACDLDTGTLPPDARPLDAVFDGSLALRGVWLPDVTVNASDSRLYDGSGRVHLALYWQRLSASDAAPRVRLTSPYGAVYGETLTTVSSASIQASPASAGISPIWAEYYAVNLNPATPAGRYHIEVMALGINGEPLPALGTDAGERWVIAGEVTVQSHQQDQNR